MNPAVRSAITLAGLSLVLVVAAFLGWRALTEPLPADEAPPVCVDRQVAAGSDVSREQVVVSVFNGSRRSGLAGSTMRQLEDRGFVAGHTGNAPSRFKVTRIVSGKKSNPAVQLVRRQFKGARIAPGKSLGPGITVIVGQKYSGLRRKQVESVTAKKDATFCAAAGVE